MSTHTVSSVEDLIERLEQKQVKLAEILRGRPVKPIVADEDPRLTRPEVHINSRDLRLIVGEYKVLLDEVKKLEK